MEIGPVEGALIQLATHLEALQLRWALIGGLAVSAIAEPRTTGDVDVVISVAGDWEAESATLNLQARGYQIHSVLEHTSGRISTVRLLAAGTGRPSILVDLLFASSGIESEVAALAEPLDRALGCLRSETYPEIGIRAILGHPEPSAELLEAALEKAVDFPSEILVMRLQKELPASMVEAILAYPDSALTVAQVSQGSSRRSVRGSPSFTRESAPSEPRRLPAGRGRSGGSSSTARGRS